MLELILTGIHVMVCLFLIFVVLLQSGQAADLAGAFGGGGSQTALGTRGAATLLTKLTTVSAIVFMLTSLTLGIAGRTERSVIDDFEVPVSSAPAPQAEPAPASGETGSGGQQGSAPGSGQNAGQGSGQDAGQGGGR